MPVTSSKFRRAPIAIAALLLIAASGCFNPFDPLVAVDRGSSIPPPEPTSPEGVVKLFEWCWNRRSIEEYKRIFAEDYTFQFAVLDTFGDAYRDDPWRYEDEMISTTNLFVGGSPTEPPATRCELTLDPTLYPFADPRPGKDPGWHQLISTRVSLRIKVSSDAGDQDYQILGRASFYLVRGDSATIPPDLGLTPDPNRWFIERWEDDTLPEGGAVTLAPTARMGPEGIGESGPIVTLSAPGGRGLITGRLVRVRDAPRPSGALAAEQFEIPLSWGAIHIIWR